MEPKPRRAAEQVWEAELDKAQGHHTSAQAESSRTIRSTNTRRGL